MNQWDLIPSESNKSQMVNQESNVIVTDPQVLSQLPPLEKVHTRNHLAISQGLDTDFFKDIVTSEKKQSDEILALARDSVAFVKSSSQQSLLLLKEQIQYLKAEKREVAEKYEQAVLKIEELENLLKAEKSRREDLETLHGFT